MVKPDFSGSGFHSILFFMDNSISQFFSRIGTKLTEPMQQEYEADVRRRTLELYKHKMVWICLGIICGLLLFENLGSIFHFHNQTQFFLLRFVLMLIPAVIFVVIRNTVIFERYHQNVAIVTTVLGQIVQAILPFSIPFDEYVKTQLGFATFFAIIICVLPMRKTLFLSVALVVVHWSMYVVFRPLEWSPSQIELFQYFFISQLTLGIGAACLMRFILIQTDKQLFFYYHSHVKEQEQLKSTLQELKTSEEEREIAFSQLQQASNNLALVNDELQQTTKELSLKNQELVDTEQFRLNMLSIVSHDLKNPITGIGGLTEVLLDLDEHSDFTRELLLQIQADGQQMDILVRDLLDTAARKMGKIELQLHPTELTGILDGVLVNYSPKIASKQQTLLLDAKHEYWVMGDASRLFQVLDNLVSNAVKYSPKGGTIRVALTQTFDTVRFSVQDEGIGLTTEDKQQLFGFFTRLTAQPTDGESSHGVGLAIVKQIIDEHGGKVWAESDADNGVSGSTFFVELPIYNAKGESA